MRPKTPDYDKLDDGIRGQLTAPEKRLLLKRCKKEGYFTLLSDFKERPGFYQASRLNEQSHSKVYDSHILPDVENGNKSLKSLVV